VDRIVFGPTDNRRAAAHRPFHFRRSGGAPNIFDKFREAIGFDIGIREVGARSFR
jgi:hypothetical protein